MYEKGLLLRRGTVPIAMADERYLPGAQHGQGRRPFQKRRQIARRLDPEGAVQA